MFDAIELRHKVVALLKIHLASVPTSETISTKAILECLGHQLSIQEHNWARAHIIDIADHEMAAYTHKGPSSIRFGKTMHPRLWHGPVAGKQAEPPKEKFPDRLAAMEARLNATLMSIEDKLDHIIREGMR